MRGCGLGEALLDLLFPGEHVCVFCGGPAPGQIRKGLCGTCLEKALAFTGQTSYCRRCGHFTGGRFCPCCREWAGDLRQVLSVVPYAGHYRELIQALKYSGRKELAPPLSYVMAARLQEEKLAGKIDLVVPVPLHPLREEERGYNQSELLAGIIAGKLRLPMNTKSLRRISFRRPQSGLARKSRLDNVGSDFAAEDGADLNGARVLLIDDVITTGSTLQACARALRQAGAREVYGLTWAAGFRDNCSFRQEIPGL